MARLFDDASSEGLSNATNGATPAYPFSYGIWFYQDAGSIEIELMYDAQTSSNDYQLLTVVTSNKVRVLSRDGGTFPNTTTTVAHSLNAWHHAVGEFASATSRDVWVDNGSSPGPETTSVTPAGMDKFYIGQDAFGGAQWSGRLAWACVWNAVLGSDNRQALADGACPLLVLPQNLVHCWPIYGNEDPEPDLISGGFGMALVNTPAKTDPPNIYMPAPVLGLHHVSGGAPPAGLSIPIAMHHYKQLMGAN